MKDFQPGDLLGTFSVPVADTEHQMRLDQYLSSRFPSHSRSFFQRLITKGNVHINENAAQKPSIRVLEGQTVRVTFDQPTIIPARSTIDTHNLAVTVVHENEHFLIINKPAPLLIHMPTKQSNEPTLVDWIVNHYQEIGSVGPSHRPGIVHRLDKDTSGIILVTRNDYALALFGSFFKKRAIRKTYLAVVQGHPAQEGSINLAIGRHPKHRYKMSAFPHNLAVVNHAHNNASASARPSLTHYRVLTYFKDAALVEVKPVTGRTHQIRVHFAAIGHPLVGDVVYGTESTLIARQALHAQELAFNFQDNEYTFVVHPPKDFEELISKLHKL